VTLNVASVSNMSPAASSKLPGVRGNRHRRWRHRWASSDSATLQQTWFHLWPASLGSVQSDQLGVPCPRLWPRLSSVATPLLCGHASRLWPRLSSVATPLLCGHAARLWPRLSSVAMPLLCGHASHLWPRLSSVATPLVCGHASPLWPRLLPVATPLLCGHASPCSETPPLSVSPVEGRVPAARRYARCSASTPGPAPTPTTHCTTGGGTFLSAVRSPITGVVS